jgi:hypothetical protein
MIVIVLRDSTTLLLGPIGHVGPKSTDASWARGRSSFRMSSSMISAQAPKHSKPSPHGQLHQRLLQLGDGLLGCNLQHLRPIQLPLGLSYGNIRDNHRRPGADDHMTWLLSYPDLGDQAVIAPLRQSVECETRI